MATKAKTRIKSTLLSPELTRVRDLEDGPEAGERFHVLIQGKGGRIGLRSVLCHDVDEALEVIAFELPHAPVGTWAAVLEQQGPFLRPIAQWKVEPGGVRRFRANPWDEERMGTLVRSGRRAYGYGMDREEIADYLTQEYDASKEEAALASAAAVVLKDLPSEKAGQKVHRFNSRKAPR